MTAPIVGIGALNRLVRETLEQAFPLMWVAGEVSNLVRAASGHLYFSLKDEAAQVRCAMFRNRAQLLPFALANGMQVEVRALVTLYEARGEFQLNVETVRRAGLGALFEAFTRLKDTLARAGLFDDSRKRALPRFPRRIGIVSSPQAAALQDILAALRRRAPHIPVIVYPSAVQGEGAGGQLARALRTASDRAECDALILARGGGSIEDLWAFNDEGLAREIAACGIPVVSGVGHESDFTIADFVADRRAATPTAAAELVSAGWFDAAAELEQLHRRLRTSSGAGLRARMQRVDLQERRLVHPAQRLREAAHRLGQLHLRMDQAIGRAVERASHRIERARASVLRTRPDLARPAAQLERARAAMTVAWRDADAGQRAALERLGDALLHLNPEATLARGFSIARGADGAIVRDSRTLAAGSTLSVRFAAGSVDTLVTAVHPATDAGGKR